MEALEKKCVPMFAVVKRFSLGGNEEATRDIFWWPLLAAGASRTREQQEKR